MAPVPLVPALPALPVLVLVARLDRVADQGDLAVVPEGLEAVPADSAVVAPEEGANRTAARIMSRSGSLRTMMMTIAQKTRSSLKA